MEDLTQIIDFKKYSNVFCDSQEALRWAYSKGLQKSAIIRTSSPSLLALNKHNIQNVEKNWTRKKIKKFQSEMLEFSKEIYDLLINEKGVTRAMAIGACQDILRLHLYIYKAGCIEKDDLNEERLFISINGYGGRYGNNMNSPWDKLLDNNPCFKKVSYTLNNSNWVEQSINSVSFYDRMRLGGFETIIYRCGIKLSKIIPSFLSKGEILITSENELIIESAGHLFKRGYLIRDLKHSDKPELTSFEGLDIKKKLIPILKNRIKAWIEPDLLDKCINHIAFMINKNALSTKFYYSDWNSILSNTHKNTKVLSNSPAGIQGNVLYDVCKKKNIPVIGVLHGVAHEISKLINVRSSFFDASMTNFFLSHTEIAAKVQEDNPFSVSTGIAVGLPTRILRMKDYKRHSKYSEPIIYASTNLYRGSLVPAYIEGETDYGSFIREYNLASLVFAKIPHKMCYKTYPEENRRYPDDDPIEEFINNSESITLIKEKVDMRYLLSSFKIIVTSGATSTLGWAVMTGKPLVFINWQKHCPLSSNAFQSLDKGVFVFDGDSENFHEELLHFLSKPIDEIKAEWEKKAKNRIKMIEKYFSKNLSKIGSTAADIIENISV